ncbi:glycosyltransferase domain-containing protein [Micromonospora sp. WMMD1082]|uniref:glycosyltransferase domain-containing protein n=1 Tax=Micromonospora sp. WMMD1082 TaxID=3016104 RepID=UPI0024165CBA|nr:glycosyltransferase domain-containing protein [Micromonospora sp. WMMD1082]MDG4792767.1 hypothetical protein [Micromonospora sp. WMMD1082]
MIMPRQGEAFAVKVVTIATDLDNRFLQQILVQSCRALELDLIILRSNKSPFRLADKRETLVEYLAQLPDRDELILFTDGYDALFIKGENHLVEAYGRFPQPVIFSAEMNCWPLGVAGLALHDTPPAGRYPYLNSGGYIGPAGVLHELLDRYPEAPSDRFETLRRLRAHGYDTDRLFQWSDQYRWVLVQLLETGTIGLDHDGQLFECYSPPAPSLNFLEIRRSVEQFQAHGRESEAYQQERTRLVERLRVPSEAAHIHFASPVTKAVALDLLDEGRWPDWLTAALPHAAHAARP